MTATARGAPLRATISYIESTAGRETLDRVLAALPAELHSRLPEIGANDEIPYKLLLDFWRAADAVMQSVDPNWMEKAGAYSIALSGSQSYGGIIRKGTPSEFLNQPIKLFRLYYHSGDMHIVEQEAGRAVLRLVDFDEPDRLFCQRQTGGLRAAIEMAGGTAVAVRHVRCAVEGDAFCEWETTWRTEAET